MIKSTLPPQLDVNVIGNQKKRSSLGIVQPKPLLIIIILPSQVLLQLLL